MGAVIRQRVCNLSVDPLLSGTLADRAADAIAFPDVQAAAVARFIIVIGGPGTTRRVES